MPIYAYRCANCGFEQDKLQKMSDLPLTLCPNCGQPELKKQVTAAGFQLKGSGWYVTDFRNNEKGKSKDPAASKDEAGAKADDKPADTAAVPAASGDSAAPAAPAASPPPGGETKAAPAPSPTASSDTKSSGGTGQGGSSCPASSKFCF